MIAWTPDLSVDIKEIDDQHKIFIAVMAEMEKAAAEHQEQQILGSTLLKLFGYAHFHFATEEKYFSLFLYPDAIPHKNVHDAFRNKIMEFRQRYEVKGEDVSAEVAPFMYNWLTNHIKTMDRQYIGNFHEHGLK